MTVAELLASKGIAADVIAGLPKEIAGHLEGYLSEADTKLSTAQQETIKAEEARRQAELEKNDVHTYVEEYGTALTDLTSANAKLSAASAYLKSLKDQGYDVPATLLESTPTPTPTPTLQQRVPGSPAMGGNAFDPAKFRGEVGFTLSQWMDANNEHMRLYGVPIPEKSTPLAEEAARARVPIGDYIAKKYKFAERQQAKEKEAYDAKVKADVDKEVERRERERSEREGSNPLLRAGEPSRNTFVQKIKGEDFHKADGNVPSRERRARMLEKIHADVAAARQSA